MPRSANYCLQLRKINVNMITMPVRIFAHCIRIYPTDEQQSLLFRTFGCCRLLYNLALEQRSVFGRPGRRISFTSWSGELKLLKAEFPFLTEVPHHCLLQALRDLDDAFSRFFSGQNGYPTPRRKIDNDSCRFPDPAQFRVEKQRLFLPKLGLVEARIHRPIQGRLKSITIRREGSQWYAMLLVQVRVKACPVRTVNEGAYDIGVAQPVVEADGTKHALVRKTVAHDRLERRVQRDIARGVKGSKRRNRAKARLRNLQARQARRRRDAAHQTSARLVAKYTHLGAEDLKLRNMTASARGTAEAPGRNVAQKAGLNRAILDVAPGRLRRMVAYKAAWSGTVLTCVNPAYTSQRCSECSRLPKDDAGTADIPHGRVSRDQFECPFCPYSVDADVNAARNILALARPVWAEMRHPKQVDTTSTAAGTAVAARRALCARQGNETRKKIGAPNGLPKAA